MVESYVKCGTRVRSGLIIAAVGDNIRPERQTEDCRAAATPPTPTEDGCWRHPMRDESWRV